MITGGSTGGEMSATASVQATPILSAPMTTITNSGGISIDSVVPVLVLIEHHMLALGVQSLRRDCSCVSDVSQVSLHGL